MVVAIMALYVGTKPHIKTAAGTLRIWYRSVGVHQGSVFRLLLFIIVMDKATREARKGVPWELVYADDLELMVESDQE